jgi:predicted HicB family RNase H-like nuclease
MNSGSGFEEHSDALAFIESKREMIDRLIDRVFRYKGYGATGSVLFSENLVVVKPNCLSDGLTLRLTAEAPTPQEAKEVFIKKVDEYLDECRETGVLPEFPFQKVMSKFAAQAKAAADEQWGKPIDPSWEGPQLYSPPSECREDHPHPAGG